ncbi:MAG: hypothetical protein ACR2FM_02675 [Candidatus Saccharimonadales bacterium]
MNELLILGGITLAIWLCLLFLRVPSSIAFLSLLIGQLIVTEVSTDVYNAVASTLHIADLRYVQATLLILPLLLTVLFLRGRVAKSKLIIEAIPTLFVAALTVLLLGPAISALGTLLDIATSDRLDAYKSIIVIAASVSGLLSAWFSYPRPAGKEHK